MYKKLNCSIDHYMWINAVVVEVFFLMFAIPTFVIMHFLGMLVDGISN